MSGVDLYCWGDDFKGRLGNGPSVTKDQTRPSPIPDFLSPAASWRSVDAGYYHTCADTSHRRLYCWGDGSHGQLGNGGGPVPPDRHSPERVGTGTEWSVVSAGSEHTCAIQTDSSLWCWGANWNFQLGDGSGIAREEDGTTRYTPRRVNPLSLTQRKWENVSSGYDHTCATTADRSLACWGSGWAGKLGIGTTDTRKGPVFVAWGPRRGGQYSVWSNKVTAGLHHTCAVKTDNTLACWGGNGFGELGDGTRTNRLEPVAVG
jgi:alpha-tubulin suppressor-like RCC1 family protein